MTPSGALERLQLSALSSKPSLSTADKPCILEYGGFDEAHSLACTECCLRNLDPVDVEWVRIGECPPAGVQDGSWCENVCCDTGSGYQILPFAECVGMPIGGHLAQVSSCYSPG